MSLKIAFERLDDVEQDAVRKFWRLHRQVLREVGRARKGGVRRGG